jgi:capsule biosynthesis phosphatase
MRICFDLDGTLCTGNPYSEAKPIPEAIEYVKKLKRNGYVIIIQTARGMNTYKGNINEAQQNLFSLTVKQLEEWGIPVDEFYMGKAAADLYVDDKGINAIDFWKNDNLLSPLSPND